MVSQDCDWKNTTDSQLLKETSNKKKIIKDCIFSKKMLIWTACTQKMLIYFQKLFDYLPVLTTNEFPMNSRGSKYD